VEAGKMLTKNGLQNRTDAKLSLNYVTSQIKQDAQQSWFTQGGRIRGCCNVL
jgi:hypothetical protein